jgi:hypothetical protein
VVPMAAPLVLGRGHRSLVQDEGHSRHRGLVVGPELGGEGVTRRVRRPRAPAMTADWALEGLTAKRSRAFTVLLCTAQNPAPPYVR